MNEADIALARRLVACPRWRWRWRPGMLTRILFRDHPCADVEKRRMSHRVREGDLRTNGGLSLSEYSWMGVDHDPLPDLSDPMTPSGVLATIREVIEDPTAHVRYHRGAPVEHRWILLTQRVDVIDGLPGDPTEIGALATALAACP